MVLVRILDWAMLCVVALLLILFYLFISPTQSGNPQWAADTPTPAKSTEDQEGSFKSQNLLDALSAAETIDLTEPRRK
jgi:hypothetical protein